MTHELNGVATLTHLGVIRVQGEDAARFLQDAAEFRTDRFWVDHFCMYSSRATKAGSRYVEEAVYPLTGVSG